MKKLACYFVVLTLVLLIIAIPSTNAQEKLTDCLGAMGSRELS